MREFWKLKTTVSRYSRSARKIVSEEVTRELAYLMTASKGRVAMIAKFLDLNSVPAIMAKKKKRKNLHPSFDNSKGRLCQGKLFRIRNLLPW